MSLSGAPALLASGLRGTGGPDWNAGAGRRRWFRAPAALASPFPWGRYVPTSWGRFVLPLFPPLLRAHRCGGSRRALPPPGRSEAPWRGGRGTRGAGSEVTRPFPAPPLQASPPGLEAASPAGRDDASEIQAAPERRRGDRLGEERAGECRRGGGPACPPGGRNGAVAGCWVHRGARGRRPWRAGWVLPGLGDPKGPGIAPCR